MTLNATNILLRHNFVAIPEPSLETVLACEALATILVNLTYYGKALSQEGYKKLSALSGTELVNWWRALETELKDLSGDNRKIGDFVVYKNFPAEVLDKSEAQYWIPQILIYWGFPKEYFTEEVVPRAKMDKQAKPSILKLANVKTLDQIYASLLRSPARWKEEEWQEVLYLDCNFETNLAMLSFKENMVRLATHLIDQGKLINISTATDVLRLAAGLSDGDISLRDKFKFKSFSNRVRRYLLVLLEGCSNLEEDVARRPELFKRLLHQLHPGDYKRAYLRVVEVNHDLYNDELETFNSSVEKKIIEGHDHVLVLLADRPGEFRRRLLHMLRLFGNRAVKAFTDPKVLDQLTVAQIVRLRSHLRSVNSRKFRVFPPKGNWNRMQIAPAQRFNEKHIMAVAKALDQVLRERLPKIQELDFNTCMITLPSNDGEVSPYNRGTVFPIPDQVDFIRTASYWQSSGIDVVWFDNGWNFFDDNWKDLGACCWSKTAFPMHRKSAGAIFSGDPINTGEMKGRAAQLIDLYPDKLLKQGVRYAVWNILCFSNKAFSEVEDVFAALQWGTGAETGKLFQPSRCQLAFPLKGNSKTKYVCLLDLQRREMTYIDANLKGRVSAASSNGEILEVQMPAFMEYIASIPTVYDLFNQSVDAKCKGAKVLYSDKDSELKGELAYLFKQENKDSKYKPLDINSLL